MNYIKHLTGFFDKVANDRMLNPTHVSLYMSLFQFWNYNRFKNPISISRDEIMRISKISSKATYHKCLKALHTQGYIKYEPSYNPFKGSHVFLFNFSGFNSNLKQKRNSLFLFFANGNLRAVLPFYGFLFESFRISQQLQCTFIQSYIISLMLFLQ